MNSRPPRSTSKFFATEIGAGFVNSALGEETLKHNANR
jgi:hypothetical protein